MNSSRFSRGIQVVLASIVAAVLCSCSTPPTQHAEEVAPVRRVTLREAPEMKDLAERARQLGNALYPQVCALLADGSLSFPRRFDIECRRRLPKGHTADAPIGRIRLNAQYTDSFRENPSHFDQVVTHELAHVAQGYWRPILGRWISYSHNPPDYWVEGIADYVSFKLGETNGSRCAQCDFLYPDYRNGYSCAGAFLLYLERTYNSNIVRHLNARLRRGGYLEDFFAGATGRSLPALWAEFRQTPAFTPNAARALELRQALGYVNGKPPRDLARRFDTLLEERADALTKDLIRSANLMGQATTDTLARMALYLYFTQAGGTAEAFLIRLKKDGKAPGFVEGDKGTLTGYLKPGDMSSSFPTTRSFTATKSGDLSQYHYEVVRDSAEGEWKLRRAWRANADGQLAEEYPLP